MGNVVDQPALNLIELSEQCAKPVIGKINGFCFTGALELALTFDFIVVAEARRVGDTPRKVGFAPDVGHEREACRCGRGA